MRHAAILHRIPRRQAHVRLAFASSTAALAVMALVEGLVLMGLGWDWGYKLLSDPFRQVQVLDFAVCHPGSSGVSLVSVFPRNLNGYQRLVGLRTLDSPAVPAAMIWPVEGARVLGALPG